MSNSVVGELQDQRAKLHRDIKYNLACLEIANKLQLTNEIVRRINTGAFSKMVIDTVMAEQGANSHNYNNYNNYNKEIMTELFKATQLIIKQGLQEELPEGGMDKLIVASKVFVEEISNIEANSSEMPEMPEQTRELINDLFTEAILFLAKEIKIIDINNKLRGEGSDINVTVINGKAIRGMIKEIENSGNNPEDSSLIARSIRPRKKLMRPMGSDMLYNDT